MSIQYKKWAVMVSDQVESEEIQRIAYSFGYNWNGRDKNGPFRPMDLMESHILYFEPNTKVITFSTDNAFKVQKDYSVVKTIEDAIILLKNPPVVETVKEVKTEQHPWPVVTFMYESESSGYKQRYVIVKKMDLVSLEGLDVNDKYSYKKFLLKNIDINDSIIFTGFDTGNH